MNVTFETFLQLQIHKCNAAFNGGENLGNLRITSFTVLLEVTHYNTCNETYTYIDTTRFQKSYVLWNVQLKYQ